MKNEKNRKTKILKLNLSATMMVAGAIVFVIIAIITAQIIATAISSNTQKSMADEETQGYTMVDSTDVDEEGNIVDVQVPVPDGFTASQVPGETTVNGGFVIYEGEVDWSKIEDLDSYAEVEDLAEEVETQAKDASTENSNTDSSNSENSEEVSEESNNEAATSNSDSTTNESNIDEEVAEEQTPDANSDQADLTGNSQENVTSEENGIPQNQIDEENTRRNYDTDSKLQSRLEGIERYQMLSQEMEENFYEMIESVKKYGGYINDTYITWYVMYEKCKNLEGEKENIETSMIWGSLWDETLQWLLESGAQIQDGEGGTREITESDINSNSSDWGNYTDGH